MAAVGSGCSQLSLGVFPGQVKIGQWREERGQADVTAER